MAPSPPHFPEETAAVYAILREHARAIAARLPIPDFYREHAGETAHALRCLEQEPLLLELRAFVDGQLDNDFGHGIGHALKVAADAGALALIEGRRAGHPSRRVERTLLVCQAAGLMHDIHRKLANHALEGARYARQALTAFPFAPSEIEAICYAIRSHEAFQRIKTAPSKTASFLADCLYDADKFRWGPDNFTDTLWDMVAYYNPSVADFVARYPGGMQRLEEIKGTFRSTTGRQYGPQMIDYGILIGKQLMTFILTEFNHLLG
jgi:hypothetical protein